MGRSSPARQPVRAEPATTSPAIRSAHDAQLTVSRAQPVGGYDTRSCRNECLIRAHIYAPPGIPIHGWLDLISCHRIAFSSVLAGNQIVGSVLPAVVKADLEIMRHWRGAAVGPENWVPRRWCARIVAGPGLPGVSAGGGLGGRCTVVLACRPSSATAYGPFEAVN